MVWVLWPVAAPPTLTPPSPLPLKSSGLNQETAPLDLSFVIRREEVMCGVLPCSGWCCGDTSSVWKVQVMRVRMLLEAKLLPFFSGSQITCVCGKSAVRVREHVCLNDAHWWHSYMKNWKLQSKIADIWACAVFLSIFCSLRKFKTNFTAFLVIFFIFPVMESSWRRLLSCITCWQCAQTNLQEGIGVAASQLRMCSNALTREFDRIDT